MCFQSTLFVTMYLSGKHGLAPCGDPLAAFKIKVVDFAEVNGNMTAQRQFGVSEKSGRHWPAEIGKLMACNPRKALFRGHCAVHTQLVDALADIVHGASRMLATGDSAVNSLPHCSVVAKINACRQFFVVVLLLFSLSLSFSFTSR